MSGVTLSVRNLLRTLASIERRLMGRYDTTSVRSLPDFGVMMISETFHWEGKHPVLGIALNMCLIIVIPSAGSFFISLPLVKSKPGALLITFRISFKLFNE